ncbi:AraC family transcriptional regulator [Nakamurella lactea]|uniref:AraC family transcriptional regulator n=1 Tax=Nakamurella lactea TaxID=459515 RepID=UPI0004105628|nr:helix-turn-helix transcriptional regulator [Nakamurella lactea]
MPVGRQPAAPPATEPPILWATGGRHHWSAGQTVAPHTHSRGHLVYAARGVLSVHTERGTSVVPTNRVAWVPAGVSHFHRAHSATDMRILFLPHADNDRLPDHPVVLLAENLARELLLTLTGPRSYAGPDVEDRGRLGRLRRVLLDELHDAREQPLQIPEPVDDRLRSIARRLQDDPADNSSLAELGRTGGASARTLSRLLQRELGMTFYQWRTQLRLAHALALLADGHDITSVAHSCGWSNPSSFIAAFTGLLGTTPGRYQHLGAEDLTRPGAQMVGSPSTSTMELVAPPLG